MDLTIEPGPLRIAPGRRVLPEERAAIAARVAAARRAAAAGEGKLPVDLAELMRRILFFYDPVQVWLFGSRARGDARPTSDWDLLVVVDDAASDAALDLDVGWRLQRGCGVYADVVACRVSEFESDVSVPNTLAFDVGREGVLLHAR